MEPKKSRTTKYRPKVPDNFIVDPPLDCPHSCNYIDNPEIYEPVRIAQYVICSFICRKADTCQHKKEKDAERKRAKQELVIKLAKQLEETKSTK